MARTYSAVFENATVTTAGGDWDLFELTPADDKPIEICGLYLAVTSELQEAQEEWIRFSIIRGHTTSGSTPISTPTPAPIQNSIETAAGFTCECNNSTIASAGTAVTLFADGFNVRAGYGNFWPENFGFGATQANTTLVVRMQTTLADDVSMTGTVLVRESP